MAIRRASKSSISTTSSGKRFNLIAGYSPAVDEMDLIQRVTVGAGGTNTISFSSIPQTYQHLQIRAVARSNRGDQNGDFFQMNYNNDGDANYSWHFMAGNGSGPYTVSSAPAAMMETNRFPGSLIGSSTFGGIVVNILDYTASKHKTMIYIGGWDGNGSGEVYFGSGNWRSVNPVTSIQLNNSGGRTFQQHTTVSLYGVVA